MALKRPKLQNKQKTPVLLFLPFGIIDITDSWRVPAKMDILFAQIQKQFYAAHHMCIIIGVCNRFKCTDCFLLKSTDICYMG